MSTNQHYIPQFLLRGFSRSVHGKKKRTVTVYFKNGSMFTGETKEVAAEKDFYSILSDIQITRLERKVFVGCLKRLQMIRPGGIAAAADVLPLISHFSARNSAHRNISISVMRKLVSGPAMETFLSRRGMLSIVGAGSYYRPLHRCMRIAFAQKHKTLFKRLGIISLALNPLLFIWYSFIILIWICLTTPSRRNKYFKEYVDSIGDFAKNKHMTAFEESLLPSDKATQLLSDFQWKVERGPIEGAILPDCVVIYSKDGKTFGPMGDIDLKEANLIYMPITTRKILVGRRAGTAQRVKKSINKSAAECCFDIFVVENEGKIMLSLTRKISAAHQRINKNLSRVCTQ
ncbi:MAG: DUF4238 domain-containing protein [Bdellovibrionales bacterium]